MHHPHPKYIHLPEIGDEIAVGLDREPAVELVGLMDLAIRFRRATAESERDDEGARPLEEAAAVDHELAHRSRPTSAARRQTGGGAD
jgi:hypothetical protein